MLPFRKIRRSGGLATFTAIRRASSRVIMPAAVRRPPAHPRSRRKRAPFPAIAALSPASVASRQHMAPIIEDHHPSGVPEYRSTHPLKSA